MEFKLTKPIVFIDLETTGLNISSDRIVEIAMLKLHPDQSTEIKTYRVNPEMPMPKSAYDIHHISDEDLKDAPPFSKIAKLVLQFIGNSDLSGYNIAKFDLPLLMEEFLRLNIDFPLENRKVVDVQHIFHKKEKRDLASAYRFYCDKKIINQHSAEADITATYEVLLAQVEKYDDLEPNIDSLYNFTGKSNESNYDLAGRIVKNAEGTILFNFGKYKGKPVTDIFAKDPGYYAWMMRGDFPQYTKKRLTELFIRWKQEKNN